MRVTGLAVGLSQGLARWRAPRAVHDPGKIVTDIVRVSSGRLAGRTIAPADFNRLRDVVSFDFTEIT